MGFENMVDLSKTVVSHINNKQEAVRLFIAQLGELQILV